MMNEVEQMKEKKGRREVQEGGWKRRRREWIVRRGR